MGLKSSAAARRAPGPKTGAACAGGATANPPAATDATAAKRRMELRILLLPGVDATGSNAAEVSPVRSALHHKRVEARARRQADIGLPQSRSEEYGGGMGVSGSGA